MNLKAAWRGLWQKAAPITTGTGASAIIRDGMIVWVNDNHSAYVNDGYGGNDVVYSIINMCLQKESMAPWAVYKIKDESSLKSYNIELAKSGTQEFDVKKTLDYRTKALEVYGGDHRLNELLEFANPEETFQDLVGNTGASKRLVGNRFINARLLDEGANKNKPKELFQMPADLTSVLATRSWPVRKTGYRMAYETLIDFSPEEVLHDKCWNPLVGVPGQELVGMAPLRSARMRLTRDRSNKTSSTKAFQNQGPPAIIWIDDHRLTGDDAVAQAGALKRKLYEEYSGPENKLKIAASGYKTGATLLGLSTVELEAFNLEKWDVVGFANVWNFPHILLIPEHSTLDNIKVAERALISRCCLPMLTQFRNHFNRKLRTDWGYKDQKIYVDYDLTVYPELSPDRKEIMAWLKDSRCSTRQWFEALQMEIPKEYANSKMLDKILLPQNLQLLEDYDPENINDLMGDE